MELVPFLYEKKLRVIVFSKKLVTCCLANTVKLKNITFLCEKVMNQLFFKVSNCCFIPAIKKPFKFSLSILFSFSVLL